MSEVKLQPGWLMRDVQKACARLAEWARPRSQLSGCCYSCADIGYDPAKAAQIPSVSRPAPAAGEGEG